MEGDLKDRRLSSTQQGWENRKHVPRMGEKKKKEGRTFLRRKGMAA